MQHCIKDGEPALLLVRHQRASISLNVEECCVVFEAGYIGKFLCRMRIGWFCGFWVLWTDCSNTTYKIIQPGIGEVDGLPCLCFTYIIYLQDWIHC